MSKTPHCCLRAAERRNAEQHKGRQQESPNSLYLPPANMCNSPFILKLFLQPRPVGFLRMAFLGCQAMLTQAQLVSQPAPGTYSLLCGKKRQKGLNHYSPSLCQHACPTGKTVHAPRISCSVTPTGTSSLPSTQNTEPNPHFNKSDKL